MRGASLFYDLFTENAVITDNPKSQPGRGRSEDLIVQRNELLLNRYFYLGKHSGKRYPDILKQLQEEFFLSEARVISLISENSDFLRKLRENPPTVQQLKSKWEHIKW